MEEGKGKRKRGKKEEEGKKEEGKKGGRMLEPRTFCW